MNRDDRDACRQQRDEGQQSQATPPAQAPPDAGQRGAGEGGDAEDRLAAAADRLGRQLEAQGMPTVPVDIGGRVVRFFDTASVLEALIAEAKKARATRSRPTSDGPAP